LYLLFLKSLWPNYPHNILQRVSAAGASQI
jgi:hypothetical protein